MNIETPLEVFLPPANSTTLKDVDLLITTNWDGLNSGVFALRVSPWSVSFLSAVLAYPIYESARMLKDRFRDQSAFQYLLEHADSPLAKLPMKGRDHWAKVPMRWFNSLPVNNAFYKNGTWIFGKNMTNALLDNGTTEVYNDGHGGKVQPWKIMQGDLVVHFAGSSNVRDSWMEPWIARAEAQLPEWNNATTKLILKDEAAAFWKKTEEQMVIDKAKSRVEEDQKAKAAKKLKDEKDKEEKERLEKLRLEKERKVEDSEKKKFAAAEKKKLDAENKKLQNDEKKRLSEEKQTAKQEARKKKAAESQAAHSQAAKSQVAETLIIDVPKASATRTAQASAPIATELPLTILPSQ